MTDEDRFAEQAPTAGEVAAEVAELGRLAAESWWRGASGLAALALATPVRLAGSIAEGSIDGTVGRGEGRSGRQPALRERGAELLRRSADIHYEQDQHPAYRRILEELAPDEARLLRRLAVTGPQPIVDVRAGLPRANRTVIAGATMIGADAGCRYPERIAAYLDNLSRLGLIENRDEAIGDPSRYQVLEAQPEVAQALKSGGRSARTSRRSLVLTPFGRDFCAACLPVPDREPHPDGVRASIEASPAGTSGPR